MTAEKTAGMKQIETVWGPLRTLRDQWFLLVFMAGALFWLRDTYDEFAALPATVAAQRAELAALANGVAKLERSLDRQEARRFQPAFRLGDDGHVVEDGRPGEWTTVRLAQVAPTRTDCRAYAIDAWLIDNAGRWFSAPTSLTLAPGLTGETELAFDVRIGPEVAPGRAQMVVQFTHDCGTHHQVQTVPRLPFRIGAS